MDPMSAQLADRRRNAWEIAAMLASTGYMLRLVSPRPALYTLAIRRSRQAQWQFYDAGTPEDAFNAAGESVLEQINQ
jgi:hypothetical protein